MNKSVIISIQPYWVFLIIAKAMGWDIERKKTLEIRKDYPKDKAWNRVTHIYCCKNRKSFKRIPKQYQPFMKKLLGKVIGEFVVDYILSRCESAEADIAEQQGCIRREQLFEYANGKDLYGWHISDLVIYDTPKELAEFTSALSLKDIRCKHIEKRYKTYNGKPYIKCTLQNCVCEFRRLGMQTDCDGYERLKNPTPLTMPPQSWCYAEV